jgi:hypothetical protein
LSDFTIATRVRWNGGGLWQRIFDFGNNTTQYLFVSPQSGPGNLRFTIKNNGAEQQLNAASALPIGEWAHVAVTLTGSNGALYLNGALAAAGSITITPAAFSPSINYLGKSQFADPLFNGAIDDFRIYNRGLAPAEVAALAAPPAATSVPDSSYAAWASGYVFPSGQSGGAGGPRQGSPAERVGILVRIQPAPGRLGPIVRGPVEKRRFPRASPETKPTSAPRRGVRKQRLGTTITPLAAPTIQGLSAPSAAGNALQAGPPLPDGDFEIFTYYYGTAIEDSPDGKGFIRLRAEIP